MDFAIIVRKYADGSTEALRSTKQPPTTELEARAKELDVYLHSKMARIEAALVKEGLLSKDAEHDAKSGNTELWYALGRELAELCSEIGVDGKRERRWLWEAIENLHATARIKRVERRRGRNHFEYCFRLARFPEKIAGKLNWGEWVYFFDSLTVREEPRIDDWLARKASHAGNVDRRLFRRFTQNLNRRIRKIDTSVLSAKELFAIYDEVWAATREELNRAD